MAAMQKACSSTTCSMRDLAVDTERDSCLSCGGKLSPSLDLSRLFGGIFDDAFGKKR